MNERRKEEAQIFHAAAEIRSPDERQAFLDRECAGDPALREKIESLLRDQTAADSFFATADVRSLLGVPSPDRSAGAPAQAGNPDGGALLPITEKPGDLIGRYKLREKVGEGGCGVVYVADQEEPVRRRVAIKVIKLGMETKEVIARFEAERQALAMMDHPNIAKVLDAGATEAGRPYFVMELVRGIKITDYCDQNSLSTRERLDLFINVCQAVQHAHQKGVIHRDLKPSNILVTLHDGVPVPKVIDFGIAKAIPPLRDRLTDKTIYTHLHQFIGTPAYMSPEQAEMSGLDIDTRSDIYSLGVLLYEMLTGQTPFDAKELLRAGLDEMRRTIREVEPPKPSTRLTQELARLGAPPGVRVGKIEKVGAGSEGESHLPTHPPTHLLPSPPRDMAELQRLIPLLRGDLDWIVMKALEKDRTRRYETATALVADLRHHLANEPVNARPPSAAYRFQKLVRRNKLFFAAGTSIVLALLFGLAATSWQAVVATRARKAAEAARAAESRERTLAQAERNRAQAATAQAKQENQSAQRNAYAAAMLVAQADWDNANFAHLRQVLLETASYPEKGFEWYLWQRLCRMDLLTLRDHDGPVSAVCYSPDGTRIASGSLDQTVRVRETVSGRLLVVLRGHGGGVRSVRFSPDGRRLITGARDGTVRIWDGSSGQLLHLFSGRAGALGLDGESLLLAGLDGRITRQDISSGRELADFGDQTAAVRTLALSPDGTLLLAANAVGEIQAWKYDGASPLIELWHHKPPVKVFATEAIAFSPDGRRLASGGNDRLVRIREATSGRVLTILAGHNEEVRSLAFSPDGRRLVSASRDRTIRVWDTGTGTELLLLKGHTDAVSTVAFSPDGLRIVTGSQDRTVKVWDATEHLIPRRSQVHSAPCAPLPPERGITSSNGVQFLRFSSDGRRIVTAGKDGTVRIWEADTLEQVRALCGHTRMPSYANFSPDGKWITSGGYDRTMRLWDAANGTALRVWRDYGGTVLWSQISKDGSKVVSTAEDGFVRLCETATGAEVRRWMADAGRVFIVEYSPDEQQLVTAGDDGIIKVWDAASGRQLMAWHGHTGLVIPLAFSPDGKKIVSGGIDRTVRVWNAFDGQELLTLHGHVDSVWDVSFSPDGRRLVSAAYDKTVRIWDVANGRELLNLRGKSDYLMAAAFSPDGMRLACAGDHPSFEVWESATDADVVRWRQKEEDAVKRWAALDQEVARVKSPGPADAIKSWLILAPIPVPKDPSSAQEIRDEPVAGESDIRPRAEELVRVGPSEMRWKPARFEDGLIDFNRFVGTGEHSGLSAYAVCYVRSDQDRQGLRLKVESTDDSRIYLNGKRIYEDSVGGPVLVFRETVGGLNLQAGLNVIVFKVINRRGRWFGSLRLVDEQENPVQGLEFTLNPD